jgi:hypothetical protein
MPGKYMQWIYNECVTTQMQELWFDPVRVSSTQFDQRINPKAPSSMTFIAPHKAPINPIPHIPPISAPDRRNCQRNGYQGNNHETTNLSHSFDNLSFDHSARLVGSLKNQGESSWVKVDQQLCLAQIMKWFF